MFYLHVFSVNMKQNYALTLAMIPLKFGTGKTTILRILTINFDKEIVKNI